MKKKHVKGKEFYARSECVPKTVLIKRSFLRESRWYWTNKKSGVI